MLLLALAIAPGIAICLFIYSLYRYGKESLRQLTVAFVLGMVGTIPPLLLQLLAGDVRDEPSRHSVWSYAWYAYVVIALSEEGSKFLLLRWYAYPRTSFRGPFDGIVYAVMIGMGFATVENIEYVWQFGLETGISRFFLAVPAHGSFAVLLGYHLGWAKWEPERRVLLMARGLLIVVALHGSFDFFLFLQQNRAVTRYVSTGVLSFGAFASFYIAVRMAMRAIRMHRDPPEETDEFPGDKSDENTNFDV